MSKIGRTLRDGTGLLWIFLTVAIAEYFRGPRNSITTALHYGKCQWVFKDEFMNCDHSTNVIEKSFYVVELFVLLCFANGDSNFSFLSRIISRTLASERVNIKV